MKTCSKCHMAKPLEAFTRNARSASGFAARCRECNAAVSRQSRADNPGVNTAAAKRWVATHRAQKRAINLRSKRKNAGQASEYGKQWRKANPARHRAHHKRWRDRHPEENRAKAARWAKANRGRSNAHKAKRRARAAVVSPEVTAFYVFVRTARIIHCRWCGKPVPKRKRQIDHIKPLSRGGLHIAENLCCACQPCNNRKHAKTGVEFTGQLEMAI